MKSLKLFIVLLSVLFLNSCEPKNNVPAIKSRFVSEQMSSVIDSERHYSTYSVTYNSNGDRSTIDAISYDTTAYGASSTSNKLTYVYDDKGFLTKSTSSVSLRSTTTTSIEGDLTYLYDTNNRIIKRIGIYKTYMGGYLTDTATVTKEYNYSNDGKLSSCIFTSILYNPGTSTIYQTTKDTYTYSNGFLSEYKTQAYNSQTGSYTSDPANFKFNSTGQLIQLGPQNQPYTKYEYDANKNLTKIQYLSPTVTINYIYDQSPTPKSLIPQFKGHPAEAVESVFEDHSPNTIIKETELRPNAQGILTLSLDIPYTVTYNSDGVVTSKEWKSSTNPKNFKKYSYTYQ